YPLIFRFVYRRIDDESTAADITSQVFLNALLHLKRYKITKAPFQSWLYRIAHNEVMQFFRHTKHVRKIVIDERLLTELKNEEDASPDYVEQWRFRLVETINTLPLDEVQLLELRFFEQKPFREIGFILNITENHAKVKTYRLLSKLRQRLEIQIPTS
ncbi:MAG: sigma-70 family RNA polymerase sigma factor, partial [Bacteroidota bacterium]